MFHFLLLAALLPISAPPADAHVTFTMRAAPLEKAVAEIARQSGANLTVDPPIAKEFVILRLKDAPIADVKKRLAETVGAEWTTQGPKEVLTRTPEIVKRRKQQAFAVRAAIWKKALGAMAFDDDWDRNCAESVSDYVKSAVPSTTFEQARLNMSRRTAFENQSAQGRLLVRALRLLGPERLAALPTEGRVVFSTAPTPVQQSFGRGGQGLYSSFVAEAATWDAALQRSDDPENIELAHLRPFSWGRPTETGMVHVVFEWDSGNLTVEPRVYGSDGRACSRLSFRPDIGFGAPTGEIKPLAGFDKPVVECEESVAIKGLMARGASPVPPLAIEILTHPEEHELLAGGPSDVAIQAAEHKDLNLIAVMPDMSFAVTASPSSKPITLGTALAMLQEVAKVDLDERSGWLTITPRNMGLLDPVVLPRRAIARLVKDGLESRRQTIDILARYCLQVEESLPMMFGQMLAASVHGKSGYVSPDGWRVLRLYAGLTSAQKAAAARGGVTLPIGRMSRSMRNLVAELVYAHDQSFSQEPATNLTPDRTYANSLNQEPTAALPDGLPGDGTVTIRLGSEPRLFSSGEYPGAGPSSTNPQDIAWRIFMKEKDPAAPKPPSGYAVCSIDYVAVTAWLPPAGFLSTSARLDNVPANAKWVPYTALPAEYRDAIAAKLEEFRTSNITFAPRNPTKPKQP